MFSIEHGLQNLEELITDEQFLLIQADIQALKTMIEEERLYGSASAPSEARWMIIGRFNSFMLQNYAPLTFNDLCRFAGRGLRREPSKTPLFQEREHTL